VSFQENVKTAKWNVPMSGQNISIRNLFINSLKPGYLPVMLGKMWLRIKEFRKRDEAGLSREWCAAAAEPLPQFLENLDKDIWVETVDFQKQLERESKVKLEALDFHLGGGGDYRLLYFLVRYMRPGCVVETGVAAGFSTQAILSGMAQNGNGRLFSSDFPYFRIEQPETYIGYLVDEELKDNWKLFIEGDGKNLLAIRDLVDSVDLFHYDSDKSSAGRSFAIDVLQEKMSANSILIMDDIQDNFFFRDFVTESKCRYHIFSFEDKYLGLIGL
jgi:predicted O-methyltransferase YrrM